MFSFYRRTTSLWLLWIIATYSNAVLCEEKGTAFPIIASMQVNHLDPRDNIEGGTISFDGKRWHLAIRIGVWGSEDYAKVSKKDITTLRKWQKESVQPHIAQHKYYGKQVVKNGNPPGSFEAIPEVKEMILEQMNGIEEMLTTDLVETKIEVFFIDTSKLKSESGGTVRAIDFLEPKVREQIDKKPFIPVKFTSVPNPQVITPGEWDPYVYPEFNAHELFHLLSRDHYNDGYPFVDYPLDGIMNGGSEFNRLRELGFKPKLHKVELNTLLLNQDPKFAFVSREKKKKSYMPNYYSEEEGWSLYENSASIPEQIEAYIAEVEKKVALFKKLDSKEKRPIKKTEKNCSVIKKVASE